MSPLKVDLALVKKYDVAGPRYTSYPPVTKFTSALGWSELADHILKNNQTERDLSLYFHIPFCESLCWYCGCTTVITREHYRARQYVDYLEKEVAQMNTLINPRRKVVQLHWGGGSPTFLRPDEIRRLGGVIRSFALADDLEAGVEIDPRQLTRDHLVALREAGFNRASIGVQDFNASVQRAIHRVQPRELTEQAVTWARELGFRSINFDLIYGLPQQQTVASFDRTLDAVLELNPDRLAVFSYAHVPWLKPAQKLLARQTLPLPEVKLQLLKHIIERLTERDRYVYIGMDHFARPTDELAVAQQNRQLQRNFQGYSTHSKADIYSFGMSAISQIPDVYWQNDKNLLSYYAKLSAGRVPLVGGYLLSREDKIRREVIMRLMCDLSLDFVALSERLDIDFESHFENELEALDEFECDGLVRGTRTGFEVTNLGRLFIRNLAMCFDHTRVPAPARQHSRTI